MITSKNAGAALGLSEYKSPDDLVRQLVREYHGAESEFVSNVATEYGKTHEKLAVMDYEMHTGYTVIEMTELSDGNFTWLYSPSIMIVDDEDKTVNIKCPFGLRNKKDPKFKKAIDQKKYYAEMQLDMAIANKGSCDFYQWSITGTSLENVPFDKEWFLENIEELDNFRKWALAQLDNKEHLEDKIKEVNTLLADELIKEHDKLKATIGDADARIKEIVKELVTICKERDSIVCGRKLTNAERKGNVDYKKVPELKGVDLDPYRKKPSKYWKFS